MSNFQEQVRRTDARNVDTDGDGWWDEAEVTGGSNPLDAASKPRLFNISRPAATLFRPDSTGSGAFPVNVTIATPQIELVLPSATGTGPFPLNITLGSPRVSVVLPGALGTSVFRPT